MYRDDYSAVYERSRALERELQEVRQSREQDATRIEFLQRELQKAHQWLAAAKAQGALPGQAAPLPRSDANTALVLGILSLAICGILGPFAWSTGHQELQKMDAGLVDDRDRGSAAAGKICGIIATAFLCIGVVVGFFVFVGAAGY